MDNNPVHCGTVPFASSVSKDKPSSQYCVKGGISKIVCRKVIVAPFFKKDNQVYFLIVKDRTHKEWTFITGGCKLHEDDLQSALRELLEETKNIVCLDPAPQFIKRIEFSTTYREPHQRIRDKAKGESIVTLYSMFFIDITNIQSSPLELRNKFRSIKNLRGAYNENLDITFETLDSFLKKNYVWRFIKQIVVKIPVFHDIFKDL